MVSDWVLNLMGVGITIAIMFLVYFLGMIANNHRKMTMETIREIEKNNKK